MIDRSHPLPLARQARLLDLSRSSLYYEPLGTSDRDLALMAAIDEIHLQFPFYGSRRIKDELRDREFQVGRHRLRTLDRFAHCGSARAWHNPAIVSRDIMYVAIAGWEQKESKHGCPVARSRLQWNVRAGEMAANDLAERRVWIVL